eukprot:SM000425S15898  [mRNA]  locus=s425:18034:19262:- [translate_table: standard]
MLRRWLSNADGSHWHLRIFRPSDVGGYVEARAERSGLRLPARLGCGAAGPGLDLTAAAKLNLRPASPESKGLGYQPPPLALLRLDSRTAFAAPRFCCLAHLQLVALTADGDRDGQSSLAGLWCCRSRWTLLWSGVSSQHMPATVPYVRVGAGVGCGASTIGRRLDAALGVGVVSQLGRMRGLLADYTGVSIKLGVAIPWPCSSGKPRLGSAATAVLDERQPPAMTRGAQEALFASASVAQRIFGPFIGCLDVAAAVQCGAGVRSTWHGNVSYSLEWRQRTYHAVAGPAVHPGELPVKLFVRAAKGQPMTDKIHRRRLSKSTQHDTSQQYGDSPTYSSEPL